MKNLRGSYMQFFVIGSNRLILYIFGSIKNTLYMIYTIYKCPLCDNHINIMYEYYVGMNYKIVIFNRILIIFLFLSTGRRDATTSLDIWWIPNGIENVKN